MENKTEKIKPNKVYKVTHPELGDQILISEQCDFITVLASYISFKELTTKDDAILFKDNNYIVAKRVYNFIVPAESCVDLLKRLSNNDEVDNDDKNN